MSWIAAASSVIGGAMKDAPAPVTSGSGGQTSGFDASGFIVNFGGGTVNARAGGAAVKPDNSIRVPMPESSGVSPWLVGAGLLAVAGGVAYFALEG